MKEVTTKITCDSCGADISPRLSGYSAEYILKVSAMNIAMHEESQAIYSMMCYPPIKDDLYFCGIDCMKKFNQ